ncbi:ABC transporter ATP-binding protein [Lysinibacillus yapensis]|uniref:ABC transporter ATP-binding protein n=1 Tax=Ureibacillus yapensis TaxID=2304605 RepID=A0A396SDQ1_9BACL|nr:ABC transporter ATP-binding protein [Lysinibacillus yapensis]RHW36704.1 ABC transporter ATP-binding protein [Lysinibacillus yapensis]
MSILVNDALDRNLETNYQIEIHNIYKSFDKRDSAVTVLENINLNVRAGEFISLLGPSGCGKSTLLKLIGGLLDQSSGRLEIDGHAITGPSKKVGFMFQKAVLLPWRTVQQNLLLPIELSKGNVEEANARIGQLLELVGLKGYEHYYPKELSGGMQQRISLARTLMTDPDILLLDEPFGALDEFTRETLNFSLMDIAEQSGKTVILVTHNISEAVLMSDKVVVLGINPGHVLETIDINIPKPRTDQVMATKQYSEYVLHIRDLLGVGRK